MDNILDGRLIVDSRNGIYCPQIFSRCIDRSLFPDISDDAWNILDEGPEAEHYWDVWAYEVEGKVSVDGGVIYQDGDVWIVYSWEEEDAE